MHGRTHLAAGIFLFLALLMVFDFRNPLLLSFFIVFGAVFPDIDLATAFLSRHAGFFSWLFAHRGFFHSIFGMLLFGLVVFAFAGSVSAIGFCIGFFSHLVLDSLTKMGVSFFVFSRRIKGPFYSGSILDRFLFFLLIFFSVCFAIVIFA